jgi:hypothetical protein
MTEDFCWSKLLFMSRKGPCYDSIVSNYPDTSEAEVDLLQCCHCQVSKHGRPLSWNPWLCQNLHGYLDPIKTLGNFVVCFFPPLSVYQVCAQLQNMWVGKKQQTSLNTMQASNFLKYTLVKPVRFSKVAAQREWLNLWFLMVVPFCYSADKTWDNGGR